MTEISRGNLSLLGSHIPYSTVTPQNNSGAFICSQKVPRSFGFQVPDMTLPPLCSQLGNNDSHGYHYLHRNG